MKDNFIYDNSAKNNLEDELDGYYCLYCGSRDTFTQYDDCYSDPNHRDEREILHCNKCGKEIFIEVM